MATATSPAVQQAIGLLAAREAELRQELAEVTAALAALRGGTARAAAHTEPLGSGTAPRLTQGGPTVRTAIRDFVNDSGRIIGVAEARDVARPLLPGRTEEQLNASARAALSHLAQTGEITKQGHGRYGPKNAEGPASGAGPSDLSALDLKGGGGSVGTGSPDDALGADHLQSDTQDSDPDRGAAVVAVP